MLAFDARTPVSPFVSGTCMYGGQSVEIGRYRINCELFKQRNAIVIWSNYEIGICIQLEQFA